MNLLVKGTMPNTEKPGTTYEISLLCHGLGEVQNALVEISMRRGTFKIEDHDNCQTCEKPIV